MIGSCLRTRCLAVISSSVTDGGSPYLRTDCPLAAVYAHWVRTAHIGYLRVGIPHVYPLYSPPRPARYIHHTAHRTHAPCCYDTLRAHALGIPRAAFCHLFAISPSHAADYTFSAGVWFSCAREWHIHTRTLLHAHTSSTPRLPLRTIPLTFNLPRYAHRALLWWFAGHHLPHHADVLPTTHLPDLPLTLFARLVRTPWRFAAVLTAPFADVNARAPAADGDGARTAVVTFVVPLPTVLATHCIATPPPPPPPQLQVAWFVPRAVLPDMLFYSGCARGIFHYACTHYPHTHHLYCLACILPHIQLFWPSPPFLAAQRIWLQPFPLCIYFALPLYFRKAGAVWTVLPFLYIPIVARTPLCEHIPLFYTCGNCGNYTLFLAPYACNCHHHRTGQHLLPHTYPTGIPPLLRHLRCAFPACRTKERLPAGVRVVKYPPLPRDTCGQACHAHTLPSVPQAHTTTLLGWISHPTLPDCTHICWVSCHGLVLPQAILPGLSWCALYHSYPRADISAF